MSGTNRLTGKIIREDREHLKQSITDILSTRRGARVLNREYGSNLFDLIDQPVNNEIDIYSAVAEALDRWEPRFKLKRTKLELTDKTNLTVLIEGEYLNSQEEFRIRI